MELFINSVNNILFISILKHAHHLFDKTSHLLLLGIFIQGSVFPSARVSFLVQPIERHQRGLEGLYKHMCLPCPHLCFSVVLLLTFPFNIVQNNPNSKECLKSLLHFFCFLSRWITLCFSVFIFYFIFSNVEIVIFDIL